MKQHPLSARINGANWPSLRRLAPVALLAAIGLLLMLWPSLLRYESYNSTMLDLGNMTQAVWSSTQGQPLLYTAAGGLRSRLASHAELIFFAITPIYALLPDPKTLLIIQGIVYAAGAFPVYVLARRRLSNHGLALVFSAIYLLYPVAQTAVLFDFHGDPLAMTFLLFAIEAADRKSSRGFLIWSALALTCKFYVAFALILLALVIWLRGSRRLAWRGLVLAASWLVVTLVLHRIFSSPNLAAATEPAISRYLNYYYGTLNDLGASVVDRALNALIIFGPAMLLGLRSLPWLLAGVAMASPALLSTGPGPAYSYVFHHYALAVPFLMAATIHGAAVLPEGKTLVRGSGRWTRQGTAGLALVITLLFNVVFVQSPLSPRFYFETFSGRLDRPIDGKTARDRLIDRWLDQYVPSQAPVAADPLIAPHIANRSTLYTLYLTDIRAPINETETASILNSVDYIVFDLFSEYFQTKTLQAVFEASEFSLVQQQDGLLLFARLGGDLLESAAVVGSTSESAQTAAQLVEGFGISHQELTQSKIGTLQLTTDWILSGDKLDSSRYVAISEFSGLPNSRIVHLPAFLLTSDVNWPENQVVRETIQFQPPEGMDGNAVQLRTSLYALDGRSLREAYAAGPVGQGSQVSLERK